MVNEAELVDVGLEAARAAGSVLLAGRRTGYDVATKSTATDMVTAMDRAAEEAIVDVLGRRRPGDGLVGEEGSRRPGTSGVRWLVDPLDGTTNYLYDIPAWSVSLAAEVDGSIVAGVVADPSHGETFTAMAGGGAWLLHDGTRRRLERGKGAAGTLELATALVGTGFSYSAERRAEQAAVVGRILPAVRDIRRLGSAALDLCMVAANRLDAYYETGTQPWDHAAGALVAAESGCWVGELEGESAAENMVVAAAPEIAGDFRRLLLAATGRG